MYWVRVRHMTRCPLVSGRGERGARGQGQRSRFTSGWTAREPKVPPGCVCGPSLGADTRCLRPQRIPGNGEPGETASLLDGRNRMQMLSAGWNGGRINRDPGLPVVRNSPANATGEATAMRSPHTTTEEKPAQQEDPAQLQIYFKKKFF